MIYSNNTYDITNDISTYTRTDFKQVYDTSALKWYMLNNLNNYEEYGIYGDSLSGTYYTGKLVIVNDHEYEWDGTEWDDLGTHIMVPYILFPNSTSASNSPYFNTGLYLKNTHSLEIKIKTPASIGTTRLMLGATERFPLSGNEYMWWISDARVLSIGQWNYGRTLAQQDLTLNLNTEYIFEIEVGTGITKINGVTQSFTVYGNNVTGTLNVEFLLGTWLGFSAPGWNGRIYYMKVKEGDNLIAYYEATNTDNTPGYIEKVSETKILQSGGGAVTYGEESGAFPKDYPEKTAPTISTLWASTIYRNSVHLTTLMRNDAEMTKIDYMSGDILKKGEVPPPTPVGPPNDEIWYTSSDSNIVTPSTSALPEIVSNTYSGGKGVIKFKTDVTSIGYVAFFNRTKLASVTIPNSVTNIGEIAFYNCTDLTSVSIGNSLTSIGEKAFQGCRSLTDISYTGTISQWNAITKGLNWNSRVPATVVHCSDGDTSI